MIFYENVFIAENRKPVGAKDLGKTICQEDAKHTDLLKKSLDQRPIKDLYPAVLPGGPDAGSMIIL
jgi:hypothetical protein